MPTYSYKREDGHVFEVRQSITDDPLERCPTTGQRCKRVILHAPNVDLSKAGPGTYEHDYKRNGK